MSYKKGDALKGSPPDLNHINFKNKDVMRWSNIRGSKSVSRPSSLVGLKGFGSSPKVKRLV